MTDTKRSPSEIIEIIDHFRELGAVHIKFGDCEVMFLPPAPDEKDIFLPEAPPEENLKSWVRMPPTPDMLRPRSR